MLTKNHKRNAYVWMEIDLNAIQHNYKRFCELVFPSVCAVVLKADAYGLGSKAIGDALFQVGCRHFFVSYLDEADALVQGIRNGNPSYGIDRCAINKDQYLLFVLDGPFIGKWCKDVYSNRYIPVLNTIQNVIEWNDYAKYIGIKLPAVLHIDTGLYRLGLPYYEYEKFKNLVFDGIDWRFFMSHPVASATPQHPANALQLRKIREIKADFPNIPFSYADTSGCLLGKGLHFDMVRIGLGLYGLNVQLAGLYNCLTIRGTILQIQEVPKGCGIGYGWKFITNSTKRIATVSCGYSDGVTENSDLLFHNFIIHDQAVPILGKVSMDLTVVDVTDVSNVQIGDIAIIFGQNLNQYCNNFLERNLTGFSNRIQRVFSSS
ncbi:MAG: alanine racemase [Holosporales bacterium]|jgi:alanine racemase|nr:alanine racemase [Holosporales bacterium]